MSADRLRQAASLLRERAEAARPDYPWYDAHDMETALYPISDTGDDLQGAAEYIATMAPPVALALADWLDEVAARDGAHYWRGIKPALAVADALIGPTT